ncbi:hypothetical protein GGD68_008375 [Paraburkholderia fungorum]|uniref:Uncharacterized protein n=1 Tax=Paraburkholderia fungorum TaxID=134537 RepID=A0AAW3V8W1_9BURK|nr:hypothetical protein [Paraburkholderia fungorum]MBB5543952.1 hypothetical protein [Paraburkholderia fungorum]MBB6207394.1 hypothetical protein [Paraburkholderia fungorum]
MSRFLLPTFLCGRQRKVGAAPHRGNANRPLTIQGKAKRPTTDQTTNTARQRPKSSPTTNPPNRQKPNPYKTLAINDKTIETTSVDINGNGYSRPNSRKVTSPGIRPIPNFLSHGQQADNTATAINVVNSQRIITHPQSKESQRM